MPAIADVFMIVGCGLLMLCGGAIKILTDYMQNMPIQRKYPPVRLFLSFLVGAIIGWACHIAGYEPFGDYRPFILIVAIGISLDIILKDLPKKVYNILGKVRNAMISKELPK